MAWVRAATGLSDQKVYLGEQNALAGVPGPLVTISLWDTKADGVDGVQQDNTNTTAKTVDLTVYGQRRLHVTFRAYSPSAFGDQTARALLAMVQLYAGFPDVRSAINAAGLGLLEPGTIHAVPKVMNSGFESQAVLEMSFCVIQTATVTVPYIETVNGEGTISNPGRADVVVDFTLD